MHKKLLNKLEAADFLLATSIEVMEETLSDGGEHLRRAARDARRALVALKAEINGDTP